jgi:hypothetical protein
MSADLEGELADLVCGSWFSPAQGAERDDVGIWVCATGVALKLKRDVAQVVAAFEALVGRGLVRPAPREHEKAPCYKPNEALWTVREATFRRRGQRSPILVKSADFSLADVVLAVAVGCARASAEPPPGSFATEPDLLLSELRVMLFDRESAEIDGAVAALVDAGLLERRLRSPARDDRDAAVRRTLRGEIEYDQRVVHRLRLAGNANPYLLLPARDFVIFYIWQSDLKRSRNHVDEALKLVVAEAAREWNVGRPLRVETGSMIGDGAVPIDSKIFERIRAAAIVVADFTPVGEFCDARCPNPNVLVEVGFALGCKEPEQVWLTEWTGAHESGSASAGKGPLPFDVDKVHRLTYAQPADLRKRLRAELRVALSRAGLVAEHQSPP